MCIIWGRDRQRKGENWGSKWRPIVKYRDTTVSCAKMAEPIEMPFGIETRVGWRNHVLKGVEIPHGKGHFWGDARATQNHGSSQLCKNGWTVTYVRYINGKLLAPAVYRCSSLGDGHLHFREISDIIRWMLPNFTVIAARMTHDVNNMPLAQRNVAVTRCI